jgi:hypothetical protein
MLFIIGLFSSFLIFMLCNGAGDVVLNSALVAICLSDYDDFVRFIFDIFAGNAEATGGANPGAGHMTLGNYADVLKTVLPRHIEDR